MSVKKKLAQSPPMGWNSYDCFGMAVTEEEVKANADFMAEHLAPLGWNHIVIDIRWYDTRTDHKGYDEPARPVMDKFSRLLPAPNKFPSSAEGKGMTPLADYIHKKGLKFGIHMMRGIPRMAVENNLPIIGGEHRAADIADKTSVCHWNADNFGLKPKHPGAQAYYDSLIRLYAYWGVDYIKADDMVSPFHPEEIEMLSRAVSKSGKDIVLSLSPGDHADIGNAEFLKERCELWRISGDVWDFWAHVKRQMNLCAKWAEHAGPGHWPDADMLPLGRIGVRSHGGDRMSRLTEEEQRCMMTLWTISRSPLMMGGHLPDTDDFALSLLKNEEVIAVNQRGRNSREIFSADNLVVWRSEDADSEDLFIAVMNIDDKKDVKKMLSFKSLEIDGARNARDLWARRDLGKFEGGLEISVAPHDSSLFRLSKP